MEWLNRASRYGEAEELAVVALSEAVSPEVEAEIRLRFPAHTKHSTQQRAEENRRALQLSGISEVTRARHLAWLAYNLVLQDKKGQQRTAADEAAAAAAATGDLEATIMAKVTLALLDIGEGHRVRALGRLEQLCSLGYTNDAALAHLMPRCTTQSCWQCSAGWTTRRAGSPTASGQARREGNAMALNMWTVIGGIVHLAAGRLSAARDAAEPLPPPQPTGVSEPDLLRIVIMA